MTLASLSRFIIAEITDAKSIPRSFKRLSPTSCRLRYKPLFIVHNENMPCLSILSVTPWVLPVHQYEAMEQLIAELPDKIVQPFEDKANELRAKLLS
jgi:hypothetical protein